MSLAESIKKAWTAVEESGVPEHMQELAFKEVLRAVLGTSQPAIVVPTGAGSGGGGGGNNRKPSEAGAGTQDGSGTASVDEHAVFAAVTEHTGVPADKLERVFFIDDGVVKLSVNHGALGRTTADKARAAALLIMVLRKIGMQADTPIELIRDECQRKVFYDGPNFSKHMNGVEGCVTKGDGKNKRFEPRTAGINAFPDLIDKILGES